MTLRNLVLGAAAVLAVTGSGVAVAAAAHGTDAATSSHVAARGMSGMPMSGRAVTVSRASSAAVTITVKDFAFRISSVARPGARVTVRNGDPTTHTVTANGGRFVVRVPAHSTRSFTAPRAVGRYRFHCAIHPTMVGTLRVHR